MKTNRNLKVIRMLLIAVVALASTVAVSAQTVRKISSFQLKVSGTSNMHDWTMESKNGAIEANLNLASNVSYLAGIQSLTFSMPVKNLKSESSLMDSRAHDALKADKFKTIDFKLISATPVSNENNRSQFKVVGQLTICGVTRQLTMLANSQKNADGSVTVTGQQKMKMTEFNVRPPSFMFGALKVGDNLTIDYTVKL